MPAHARYRGRPIVYAVSIALFAIIATAALLLTQGYTIDFSSGALQKRGLLVLDSNPKDAFITVNGRLEDERTRARLGLAPGRYTVKVDLPDVHPWQKQVTIEPGAAALEEHILLFLKEPIRFPFSSGAAVASGLAPDGRRLAVVESNEAGATLTVAETDGEPGPRAVASLPRDYAAPRSLDWLIDGSGVIVSSAAETRLVGLDGRQDVLAVVGPARSFPRSSDAVSQTAPGVLSRTAAGGTTGPLIDRVTAWTTSTRALWASRTDGSLVRFEGTTPRTISRGPALVDISTPAESDRLFGRSADGTLVRLDGDRLRAISPAVDQYAASRDADQVAYLTQRELRLWDRLEDRDRLLTRFTDPPTRLAVVPGGDYVLYQSGDRLHAIAADGSNDTELGRGIELLGIIDREAVIVRDAASGRIDGLRILRR